MLSLIICTAPGWYSSQSGYVYRGKRFRLAGTGAAANMKGFNEEPVSLCFTAHQSAERQVPDNSTKLDTDKEYPHVRTFKQ
ncbi:uncharacterized protein EpC_07900 [Erwinia pyrifoliae Ep1/96]|nr:uncharacterized protein EpC_07900 [Erwinia pyrifoliae Ep1/96]